MSSLDDLSFSIDDIPPHQRAAFRALVRGLLARLDDDSARYNVYDISSGGCTILNPPKGCAEGRMLLMQLEVRGMPLVSGMETKVVRMKEDGSAACAFVKLTRHQELVLDKLVLEIQKALIAQKKI